MAKYILFKSKDKEGELNWSVKQDLFWGGVSIQLKQTTKGNYYFYNSAYKFWRLRNVHNI